MRLARKEPTTSSLHRYNQIVAAKKSLRPKGPPPLPKAPNVPRHDTIDVDSRWLIPPLPKEGPGKATEESRKQPPPLPAVVIAVKPRGKLPPPLPREDDSAAAPAPKSPKRGARTSRRPPPLRK
jgi:hypothetical protein